LHQRRARARRHDLATQVVGRIGALKPGWCAVAPFALLLPSDLLDLALGFGAVGLCVLRLQLFLGRLLCFLGGVFALGGRWLLVVRSVLLWGTPCRFRRGFGLRRALWHHGWLLLFLALGFRGSRSRAGPFLHGAAARSGRPFALLRRSEHDLGVVLL